MYTPPPVSVIPALALAESWVQRALGWSCEPCPHLISPPGIRCVVQGWAEAVKGCSYVIHVASPVVVVPPKDESVIIDPAVQVVYAYSMMCAYIHIHVYANVAPVMWPEGTVLILPWVLVAMVVMM